MARHSRTRVAILVRVLAVSVVIVCNLTSFAQSSSPDISQYAHTSWTVREGVLPSGLRSLGQSSDGYLWIGTNDQLLRFDGVRFTTWKPKAGTLPRGPYTLLLGTRDGGLWVGGTLGTAFIKDGVVYRFPELAKFSPQSFLQDKQGTMWLGGLTDYTSPSGPVLYRFENGHAAVVASRKDLGGYIGSLFLDHAGSIWMATGAGIWEWNGRLGRFFADKQSLVPNYITETSDGSLLIGDGESLHVIDAGRTRLQPSLKVGGRNVSGTTLLVDKQGALWSGTLTQGLWHAHDGRLDSLSKRDGLSGTDVQDMLRDREGTIWVLTSGGLDRFRRYAVTTFTEAQGLANDSVTSVLQTRDGTVLLGTGKGVQSFVGEESKLFNEREGLAGHEVSTLLETTEGKLLVGTGVQRGLSVKQGHGFQHFGDTTADNILQIVESPDGTYWLLDWAQGLEHLDSKGRVLQAMSTKQLGFHPISEAWDTKRDGLWLGSSGSLRLWKNGAVVQRLWPFADGKVTDISVDESGAVWAGTRTGLLHWNGGSLSFLDSHHGLPCDAVNSATPDHAGKVWLFTGCGLLEISRQDLATWAEHPDRNVTVLRQLRELDGAPSSVGGYLYNPNGALTRDGRLLTASPNGVSILDTEHLSLNSVPPPVHIEDVQADGKQYDVQSLGSLPPRVRSIRFSFSALSLAEPRKMQVRYRLDGFDSNWQDAGPMREATYTNLSPGNYRLRLIATNNDGVWSDGEASLGFRIAPAYWQTMWFEGLMVLALVGALVLVLSLRLRALTARVRYRLAGQVMERERVARELHDTLLQQFQASLLHFDIVARSMRAEDPTRLKLEKNIDRVMNALSQGRDAVRNLRVGSRRFEDLVQCFERLPGEYTAPIMPRLTVNVVGHPRQMHAAAFDEISCTGEEAVRNALQHAGAANIAVTLRFGLRNFVLTVADDGKGLPEGLLAAGGKEGHWGLKGMNERAARLRGRLAINSRRPTGTLLTLSVRGWIVYSDRPSSWSKWQARLFGSLWWDGGEAPSDLPHP